jgi:DNA-binding transcriptional ArsR family regulator
MTDVYSAFGNKIRAKLILCLARGSKNVGDLVKNCGLSQSAVSQHLAKLKKAKIVDTQKNGRNILYFLRYKKAVKVSKLLESLEEDIV